MKYRFGVIFDFEVHLKNNDPTNIFGGANLKKMLEEIVLFLTEDVHGTREAHKRINDIEYLMDRLYYGKVIDVATFAQDQRYTDTHAILFSICESIVEMFLAVGFYKYCRSFEKNKPKILHISRKTFAIVVGSETEH